MRLMFRVPEAKQALELGTLNLTQAAMAERHLRREEKETSARATKEEVRELLGLMENKSKRETEKVLLKLQPIEIPQERIRPLTETMSEVRFPISEETRDAMKRFWELKGRCSVSEVFTACLGFYLRAKDPQQREDKTRESPSLQTPKSKEKQANQVSKSFVENNALFLFPEKVEKRSEQITAQSSAETPDHEFTSGSSGDSPKRTRYIPSNVREALNKRSNAQCEYVDTKTKRRCTSRYLLQVDHIEPFGLGGTSEPENLRMLCASHNNFLGNRMYSLSFELDSPSMR